MQKIRHIVCNIHYIEITTIFLETKYILLKKILENSNFADLNLVVVLNREEKIYIIISHFYKSNTQIWQIKQ